MITMSAVVRVDRDGNLVYLDQPTPSSAPRGNLGKVMKQEPRPEMVKREKTDDDSSKNKGQADNSQKIEFGIGLGRGRGRILNLATGGAPGRANLPSAQTSAESFESEFGHINNVQVQNVRDPWSDLDLQGPGPASQGSFYEQLRAATGNYNEDEVGTSRPVKPSSSSGPPAQKPQAYLQPSKRVKVKENGYCLFMKHKARETGSKGSINELMGMFDKDWKALSDDEKKEWRTRAKTGEWGPSGGKSERSGHWKQQRSGPRAASSATPSASGTATMTRNNNSYDDEDDDDDDDDGY